MQRLKEGWVNAIRRRVATICLVFLGAATVAMAQNKVTISGKVVDESGEVLPGVSVAVSGTTTGTITDFDGNYSLSVPVGAQIVYSFVGFDDQNITVAAGQNVYNITLKDSSEAIEEIVVVGFGQQKKASVVGAIAQTTGETLERAAGISDIGQALTGNLPGVVTVASQGMPGEENPTIVIRGSSTWNGSKPLVLVDGVKRDDGLSTVDMSSVESLSVLKDASATAVFGVEGANGVILITTKRGREGKANINVQANAIMKMPSKLPNKYDSYDALMAMNMALEHELNSNPESWGNMRPQYFIDCYRNQEGKFDENGNPYSERYANVDWQDATFKKHAMSYNANINVSGGTKFVRYFTSVDYVNEGDLFKEYKTGRDYKGGYAYNRVGVRANLDFNFTKSTLFKVGISGTAAFQKAPYENRMGDNFQIAQQWIAVYGLAPDAFLPKYSDGSWGYSAIFQNQTNSTSKLWTGGYSNRTQTSIRTDFTLEQDLSFLVNGLSLRGMIAWDNSFTEQGRGVNDMYHGYIQTWVNPDTGSYIRETNRDAENRFLATQSLDWSTQSGNVDAWGVGRNLNYQAQINWNNKFDNHTVGAMGAFSRRRSAYGATIPSYREDWVFRATYDWKSKYFLEYNGAYNGSEKYGPKNRFAFFQSGALGWTISEEDFMSTLKEKGIIDNLKFRVSYGEIGDDSAGKSFLYMTTWKKGNKTHMNPGNPSQDGTPYPSFLLDKIGNPDIHWEVVRKFNFGVDYAFLNGLLAGSFEVFKDKRSDIVLTPKTPVYFGSEYSAINFGKAESKGYELELRVNKQFENGVRLWANFNVNHAENKVTRTSDHALFPNYRKDQGYAIHQSRYHIDKGFVMDYNDLYGTTKYDSNDNTKGLGSYHIMDFDGNGVIDPNDSAPYQYSRIPQNTYNATIGVDWNGWNAFVQFYGVSNVTRDVTMSSFYEHNHSVYNTGTWWSENPKGADQITEPYNSKLSYQYGTQFACDGSFIRLKNAEIGYTFNKSFNFMQKIHFSSLKLFVSGNNLWLWSHMPDDRESNTDQFSASAGAYPTVRRINFGLKFSL